MSMHQRVNYVDAVGSVVQYPPNGWHRVVQLPKNPSADHEYQVVQNRDGH